MFSLRLVGQFLCIPEIPWKLLANLDVTETQPLYEIQGLPVALRKVEHSVDFPIVSVVNNPRLWFALWLASCIRCVMGEQRDMEVIVLPNRMQKVHFVSMLRNDLTYHLQSCPCVIQLLGWSCHPEVPCHKPDLISNLEINLFEAGILHLKRLSFLEVLPESLVSLLHASCDGVCLDFKFQARWLLQGLKLHYWMVMAICQEWSPPGRSVYRVIVSQFG